MNDVFVRRSTRCFFFFFFSAYISEWEKKKWEISSFAAEENYFPQRAGMPNELSCTAT